ncbi:MAG: carboxypeptidase regulatory-like domain-containing protein [Actinomycetia bacterium]|nr:carboxypeptidase regulatory-like domain-containing protein [Actinomycetes bacterium]
MAPAWWRRAAAWARDRRGVSQYVALAIAAPVLLMAYVGGSALVETVSTQAALHNAAEMVDRSLVADGCLTQDALAAVTQTLQANHVNPNQVYLNTTGGSGGPALYGARGLTATMGYDLNLTLPGTPWTIAHDYVQAQVTNDQSQYVPQAVPNPSACVDAATLASTFAGTQGGQGSGGAASSAAPPATLPTALTEQVSPNPAVVGQTVTVSGQVTTGSGPAGAGQAVTVTAAGQTVTATTDSQGAYTATLSVKAPGQVTITATAGLASQSATLTVEPPGPATITWAAPRAVTVGQAFSLQGTVLTADGQPVADGTAVTITSNDPTDLPTQTVTTVGGQFTVSVPAGITALTPNPVTVTATAGSVSQTASVTVQPGAPQTVTLTLSPAQDAAGSAWTVSGTVRGPDDTPVAAGTAVQLGSTNDKQDGFPTLSTNAQGQFSGTVTLTLAGSVTVTAQAGAATSAPVTVTVTPGAPAQLVQAMATPNPVNQGATTVLSGTVLDTWGNPVAAGTTLTLTSTAWPQPVAATVGAQGQVSVPVTFAQAGKQVVTVAAGGVPLQNGTFTVNVSQQGAYSLTATQTATTLTAGQSTAVTFTLTDSQGQPVPNEVLTFTAQPGAGTILSATQGTTNAQGQVTISVTATQAGLLTVTAALSADNGTTTAAAVWQVSPAAPVSVDPPAITPSVAQSVQDGGTVDPVITGVAVDPYGNPIPGATVTVTGGWDPGVPFTGTANAQGYFSIPLTPVAVGGPYDPTITVSDAAGSQTATYTDTSLTVVAHLYQLVLVPAVGAASTPAGTPFGVTATLTEVGVPVANAQITFTVSGTDAGSPWAAGAASPSPNGPSSVTVTTDGQGQATATVAFEPDTGTVVVTATYAVDNTSGTLDVAVTPNAPALVAWDEDNGSGGAGRDQAGQPVTFVVQALDAYGFPVADDETVSWAFDGRSGTTTTGPLSGWSGIGYSQWTATPTTAGAFAPQVTIDGQTFTGPAVTVSPGPVQFLYPVLGPANNTNGTLLPGGTWNGTTMAYGQLPASDGNTVSVRFTAYDAYGNAVPGWSTGTVTCAASGGGSCPALVQPAQPTNAQGQSGWVNEGPFAAGSYQLTFTPSGGDTASGAYATAITFQVVPPITLAAAVNGNGVYVWEGGTQWRLLAPIPTSSMTDVGTIAYGPSGQLVIAGSNSTSTPVGAYEWTGSAWQSLGGAGAVSGVAFEPNGTLVGWSSTYVGVWQGGTSWQSLGFPSSDGSITDVSVGPNGEIAAGDLGPWIEVYDPGYGWFGFLDGSHGNYGGTAVWSPQGLVMGFIYGGGVELVPNPVSPSSSPQSIGASWPFGAAWVMGAANVEPMAFVSLYGSYVWSGSGTQWSTLPFGLSYNSGFASGPQQQEAVVSSAGSVELNLNGSWTNIGEPGGVAALAISPVLP